jgi:hypothetical protein
LVRPLYKANATRRAGPPALNKLPILQPKTKATRWEWLFNRYMAVKGGYFVMSRLGSNPGS